MASLETGDEAVYEPPQMAVKSRSIGQFAIKSHFLYEQWQEAVKDEQEALETSSDQEQESSLSISPLSEKVKERAARYIEYSIAGIDRKRDQRVAITMGNHHSVTSEWLSDKIDDISHILDFDSLMGRCSALPWTSDLQVFPLFTTGFPITNSLHIGYVPGISGKKVCHY